jgi:hypothetical protein
VSIILERSVNYFDHFGGGVFFLKIDCVECNFTINSGGVSIICIFFFFFLIIS